MSLNPLSDLEKLGDYLRQQRTAARLSLRQLADLAGVSNPYLSQIERGLKRPSAEILQQLAKGLEVSAESLYVRAGILDERAAQQPERSDVRRAIADDQRLTARQKQTLLEVYESFVGSETPENQPPAVAQEAQPPAESEGAAPRRARTKPAASAKTTPSTTKNPSASKPSTSRARKPAK